MNQQSQCHSFLFEGAANSEIVMACFDAFAEQIQRKTVVILDQLLTIPVAGCRKK